MTTTSVSAHEPLPPLVAADEAEAITREAIIFAYPMLFNYKTIWEQTQDSLSSAFIGGFNRYRHYTHSYTSSDTDIVTPNNDSPYSWAWFDLRREPVVLRVPKVAEDRYYVVQMFDLFTYNFAYVGVRSTGFDAGDYLIAPVDWDGEAPEGICDVLRSETRVAGTLTRTALFGDEDMPNVRAIQHGYAIQPLSEYAGLRPPPPVPLPAFPPWDQARALSADFIGYLNFLLGLVVPHASEDALYQRLAGIGIAAGRPWQRERVPADVLAGIQTGVKDGLRDIKERASQTTFSIGLFGSRQQLAEDYLTRAVAADMGIYGQVAEEAVYGGSRLDASGNELTGDQHYELRFDQATLPEAKFFWSITLYELPSRLLAANPIDRYSIGDRTPHITYGDDGSLAITLQAEPPDDPTARAILAAHPGPRPVYGHLPPLRPRAGRPTRPMVPAAHPKSGMTPACGPDAPGVRFRGIACCSRDAGSHTEAVSDNTCASARPGVRPTLHQRNLVGGPSRSENQPRGRGREATRDLQPLRRHRTTAESCD